MKNIAYVLSALIGFAIANSALAQAESDGDFRSIVSPSKAVKFPVKMLLADPSSLRVLIPTGTEGDKQKIMTFKEWVPTAEYPYYIHGLGEQPRGELLNKLIGENPVQGQARVVATKELASWYASYVGKDLPEAKKAQLASLYRSYAAQQPVILNTPISRKAKDAGLKRNADFLVSFLLAERKLIADTPSAQVARYRRVLPAKHSQRPSTAEKKVLVADARKFLSLDYAREPRAEVKQAPSLAAGEVMMRIPGDSPGMFTVALVKVKMTFDELHGHISPMDEPCDPNARWTQREAVGEPYADAFRHDVILAEHAVTGDTWEAFGLPPLYHTSIVVEELYREVAIFEEKLYKCEGTMMHRIVESTKKEAVYNWRHLNWPMAHGAMGNYEAGDTLTLIQSYGGSAPNISEWVYEITFGTSADDSGARCRGRYGAYPRGLYGGDFVCHQNINAFARVKWGIYPVWRWDSLALFGLEGLLGVGDIVNPCKCPVTGVSHVGCIPGAGCCCVGQGDLEVCEAFEYNQGTACGHGLGSAWHPTKGWIASEFRYTECPVEIPGADSYVGTFPVQ